MSWLLPPKRWPNLASSKRSRHCFSNTWALGTLPAPPRHGPCADAGVDLHISTEEKDGLLTVRVAGRLGKDGLGELRRACCQGARVRLDLSDLVSADEAGTTLIAAMRDSGTDLVGVPPYIGLLLRARLEPTP